MGLEGEVGVMEPQRSWSDGTQARAASSGWWWWRLVRLDSGIHTLGTERQNPPREAVPGM